MSSFTASVPNFSLTSTWIVQYLGSAGYRISSGPGTDSVDKTFDFTGIPAGSVINSATLTANMNSPATGAALRTVDGGSFSGSKGVSITPGGYNTFRFRFKANGSASAPTGVKSSTLSLSDVTISVDYNPPGGGSSGGAPPPPPQPPYIGNLSVSPTAITAGGSLYVATGACDGGLIRDISVYRADTNAFVAAVVSGHGIELGEWMFPIPVGWCEFAPNDTQFQLRIELYAHYPDGGWGGVENKTVTVYVPEDIKPTIGSLTAAYNANGVNGAITKYVQNYSKVNIAMGSVSGAYGSSVVSHEITGGGFSALSSSATFGPFSQSGDITITAKVVDSRGRVGLKTVEITILPYGPPNFSSPQAWRSNYDGVKNQKGTYVRVKSGASFSSLDGQNAVTLKGRVYLKGGEAPDWDDMVPNTELILGGGALLFTRTYIAQIEVADLINTRTIEFIIPTKKTGISIMAGMSGAAIGKSAETTGILDVAWPIVAPNFYPVGAIYISTDSTSPATLFGGTWASIDAGRFLVASGTGYPAGGTGGAATHLHTLSDNAYAQIRVAESFNVAGRTISGMPNTTVSYGSIGTGGTGGTINEGTPLRGNTDSTSNLPPYLAVYMWRRTA